ncbi:MAG: hypothetical protein ACFFHD_10620, partial [Promethearchaeota archaeon]
HEAINAYYDNSFSTQKVQEWLTRLKKVYNRGFSTGFYFGLPKGSEIEREREGNISDFRKIEIGKVLSYFPEKSAAKIMLIRGKLKLGDEIFIIGTHTDTYLHQNIQSIQIKKKKNLTETPHASKHNTITVGILVDKPVKKNDKIFKLESINKNN